MEEELEEKNDKELPVNRKLICYEDYDLPKKFYEVASQYKINKENAQL